MGDYDPLALPPAPGRMLDAPRSPRRQQFSSSPNLPCRRQQARRQRKQPDALTDFPKPKSLTPFLVVRSKARFNLVNPHSELLLQCNHNRRSMHSPVARTHSVPPLMQQGIGALDQGLTARENRAIQEAARARATNMGRTFDQTASIKEAEDVIKEDNARRMQNRAFAQRALGQEVGIQQADLARGLQAQQLEMARQSAGADRQLSAEEKDIERAMRRGGRWRSNSVSRG